jgi:hypothetical protein
MNCTICTKDYVSPFLLKEYVECHTCDFRACIDCTKTYFTTSGKISCMNCRVSFDKFFVYTNLGMKFSEKLYKDIAIKEQLALVKFEEPLLKYYKEYDVIRGTMPYETDDDRVARDTVLTILNDTIDEKRNELYEGVEENRVQRYKCVGCNEGVVELDDLKCSRCDLTTCIRCMKVEYPNHKCTEGDLESVIEIQRTSVKCPTCLIYISKIEGCNQMFCIECHTPFSYTTGMVIRNTFFHNPHYMEFLDRNPTINIFTPDKQVVDSNNECYTFASVNETIKIHVFLYPALRDIWLNLHRYYVKVSIDLATEPLNIQLNQLRRQYMIDNLTLGQFEDELYDIIHMNEKEVMEQDCLLICFNIMTDLLMATINNKISDQMACDAYFAFLSDTMRPMLKNIWNVRGWVHDKPRIV